MRATSIRRLQPRARRRKAESKNQTMQRRPNMRLLGLSRLTKQSKQARRRRQKRRKCKSSLKNLFIVDSFEFRVSSTNQQSMEKSPSTRAPPVSTADIQQKQDAALKESPAVLPTVTIVTRGQQHSKAEKQKSKSEKMLSQKPLAVRRPSRDNGEKLNGNAKHKNDFRPRVFRLSPFSAFIRDKSTIS